MSRAIKLSESAQKLLCCPICGSLLIVESQRLLCRDTVCGAVFPIIDGVPILLNESESVFSLGDFRRKLATSTPSHLGRIARRVSHSLPCLSENRVAKTNYRELANLLQERTAHPRVLVIGGRVVGQGMDEILFNPGIEFIETDVVLGPRTALICDARDIPFSDESFDGVIAQAVLEHVADPYVCVREIHRVLKADGLVYAETPFMQQVHLGRYDFTRFTHLGHRRLFRSFAEVKSGPVGGPAMSLAWAWSYFVMSFAPSQLTAKIIGRVSGLLVFWLKYLDRYLVTRPGAFDSASGYYFMGSKSKGAIPDRDLVRLYRGLQEGA